MTCKKCGGDNGWNYLDCLCSTCKGKKLRVLLAIAIPLALISMIIGGLIGNIQYDYDIDKCKEMDTSDVAYEFTHDVQINVQYSENCYYMNNHPMAHFWAIFSGAMAGLMIILMITLMATMTIFI